MASWLAGGQHDCSGGSSDFERIVASRLVHMAAMRWQSFMASMAVHMAAVLLGSYSLACPACIICHTAAVHCTFLYLA